MNQQCSRCGKSVQNLIQIDDAVSSAQYSDIIGVPYPVTDHVCITCAREILGIPDDGIILDEFPGIKGTETRITQSVMTNEELLREVEVQRALMIAVATGGPRIEDVNHEYIERRRSIAWALSIRGLEEPNPHDDLWRWYGKWSSGGFPTYQSRREYIADLYNVLVERLSRKPIDRDSALSEELTGWMRVDRAMNKARLQLEVSANEEDFQQIGLLCREILISLGQAVYDPNLHETLDSIQPSSTDAKRMLEAYIAKELTGGSNQVARRHARAALDLANDLQHRRTAKFREAVLCAEATFSVVNIIVIVCGRKDPK